MTVLIFYVTTELKGHVTFWVEPPHADSALNQVLGTMGLVDVEIKRSELTLDHMINVSHDFVGEVLSS